MHDTSYEQTVGALTSAFDEEHELIGLFRTWVANNRPSEEYLVPRHLLTEAAGIARSQVPDPLYQIWVSYSLAKEFERRSVRGRFLGIAATVATLAMLVGGVWAWQKHQANRASIASLTNELESARTEKEQQAEVLKTEKARTSKLEGDLKKANDSLKQLQQRSQERQLEFTKNRIRAWLSLPAHVPTSPRNGGVDELMPEHRALDELAQLDEVHRKGLIAPLLKSFPKRVGPPADDSVYDILQAQLCTRDLLLVRTTNGLRFWDCGTGPRSERTAWRVEGALLATGLDPTRRWLAFIDRQGPQLRLRLRDLERDVQAQADASIELLLPNVREVVLAKNRLVVAAKFNTLAIYEFEPTPGGVPLVRLLEAPPHRQLGNLMRIVISNDARFLVVAGENGTIGFDLRGKPTPIEQNFQGHRHALVAIAQDSRTLALVHRNSREPSTYELAVYEMKASAQEQNSTITSRKTVQAAKRERVEALEFLGTGELLVRTSSAIEVFEWSASRTWRRARDKFVATGDAPGRATVLGAVTRPGNDAGQFLVFRSDGRVALCAPFDRGFFEELGRGHYAPIQQASFSTDGKRIVTVDTKNHIVRTWTINPDQDAVDYFTCNLQGLHGDR